MPRIPPRAIWQARAIDKFIPRLLPVCRDVRSAQLELRWLREHAAQKQTPQEDIHRLLEGFVKRRSQGEPLQYVLGTEYFGHLEIRCRPGVLIPRQETAISVSHLVELLSRGHTKKLHRLSVLDVCTGTGCIPLLFHHDFYFHPSHKDISLELIGLDISQHAISLAEENLTIQLQAQEPTRVRGGERFRSLDGMSFLSADALQLGDAKDKPTLGVLQALQRHAQISGGPKYDVLISNPPYISSQDYLRTTSRSVRGYEPKLALVPPHEGTESTSDGDRFYPRLLDIADQVAAKVALFEVADLAQAERVAGMAIDSGYWEGVEIWRDQPCGASSNSEVLSVSGEDVNIQGSGHGRSVLLYRNEGKAWLDK